MQAAKVKDFTPKHVHTTNQLPVPLKEVRQVRVPLDPENFSAGMWGDPNLRLLVEMHTYMRPGCSMYDEDFTNKFIVDALEGIHTDGYGNHWYQVGEHPSILWTCHTDTVHRLGLAKDANGRQEVAMVDGKLVLADPWGKASNCLGADDTAGIWLMLEMIRADVPGLYVFFRDEEIGGLGSSWASKNCPEYFEGIKAAISLDRKGKTSIITHQGTRTASDAFAASLGKVLGMGFKADPSGVFTDSANLTDVVGECSNLSVGYEGAHGPLESVDIQFLIDLRATLIGADYSALVFERKPGDTDPEDYFLRRYSPYDNYASRHDSYYSQHGFDDVYGGHDRKGRSSRKSRKRDILVDGWESDVECGWDSDRYPASVSTYQPWGEPCTIDFVKDNYGLVADFLEFNGFNIDDIEKFAEDVVFA